MPSSNPIYLFVVFAAAIALLLSIFGQPAYCGDSAFQDSLAGCSEYSRAQLLHEKHISMLRKAVMSKPGHTTTISVEEMERITDLYNRYCYMRDVGRVHYYSEQLKTHSYQRRMESCRRELIQSFGQSAVIAIDKDLPVKDKNLPAKPKYKKGPSPYQPLVDQIEKKRKEVIHMFSAPPHK